MKNGEEEIELPREPAHVIALAEILRQLCGGDHEYYSRLTDTRQYLDNRYGVSSPNSQRPKR